MPQDPRSPGSRYVAVYDTQEHANAALRRAVAVGTAEQATRQGNEDDRIASLRGEMREELDHNIGGVDKEMTKGMAFLVPIFTVAGILLALPFAALSMSGLSLVSRLVLVGVCGATFGGVTGAMVGARLNAKDPQATLASERGLTVSVGPESPAVARALADAPGMIRVDVVTDAGIPVSTVTTEEDYTDGGVVEAVTDRLLHGDHEQD